MPGGTKRLRCLLMIPRQLPLLACLVLLAVSLVAAATAAAAAAAAPTRLAALWDAPLHESITKPAARTASTSGAFTLQPHSSIHHLQPQAHKWLRTGAIHSLHHLTATNTKRQLSQTTSSSRSAECRYIEPAGAATEGGAISDSLPDHIYPLTPYVQSGAIPKGHFWHPLDLSKDLWGVLKNCTEDITEEERAALTACMVYSSHYDGACCIITSYEATVDGCMVVRVFPGVAIAEGLHDWTDRLPTGVKVLNVHQLNLTRGLPVSFGKAATSLEQLIFSSNNFTGTLPQGWDALSSIKYIDLRWNPLLSVDVLSPAWVMPPWGQLSHIGSNVWSKVLKLFVETAKVPADAFSQGWLALDNQTLIPVNGSGAGSPFRSLPGGGVSEVPQGHLLRPFDLGYNLSVLASMDRGSDTYAVASSCQRAKDLGLQEGACCSIMSYEAAVAGCTVVDMWPGVEAGGMHDWTPKLPAGVKVLSVGGLGLTGSLPVSFGSAAPSLEQLLFSSNNFTGTLPQEWGALSSIKYIDLRWNPLLSLDSMTSPAWVMRPWGEISDLGSNVWSTLWELWVESDKVPADAFSQGWLALDNETLIPVNGSGAGSPLAALPGLDVSEVPQGHLLPPFDLAYNLSVLTTMDRAYEYCFFALTCQGSKNQLGLQEGACCAINSYEATVDGCVVVALWPGVAAAGLHDWTMSKLPAGLKALTLAANLTGNLPASFGRARASLEFLAVMGNNFTGELPASWAELPALRGIFAPNNNLTGTLPAAWSALSGLETLWLSNLANNYQGIKWGNAFIGTLPSEWSKLQNLSAFACGNGACTMLRGVIPDTWAGLCKLEYFSLYDPANSSSQLSGRLPWKWMYELSNKWRDEDIESCFPDVVDIPSGIECPRYVCLARGHSKITTTKSYRRNDGAWAYISSSTGSAPEAEAETLLSEFTGFGLDSLAAQGLSAVVAYGNESFDVRNSACTSINRFILIPVVYSVFGFVMLCAVVALFIPTSVPSCLMPASGRTGRLRSLMTKCYNTSLIAWIVKHGSVILSVLKVGSVMFDMGSDIYAAYVVKKTSFVWGFVTMLMVPNVVAAFVLHLNLAYSTTQQQQSGSAATNGMAQATPVCYPLYQWLYKKGGIGLLLFTAIFFVPCWLLWEVPMVIAAAIGHVLGHVWQRLRASRFTAPWLNLGHFLALLSLVMACTESPFTAALFTYHYAKGVSYSFPAWITDWAFVLTVGSALLHIAVESWAVVLSIKGRRFKKSIMGMFWGLLSCSTDR